MCAPELITVFTVVCVHVSMWLTSQLYRSVPHIRPPFATLALVKNVEGAYMGYLTFYLANTPPIPVPRLDVHILQTDTEAQHVSTPVCLVLQKLEYLLVKID